MNRRGFLSAILAAGMAPAVCKAANLMPVFVRRESGLLIPETQKGTVITLYDALGRELAHIPMYGSLDPASLCGHAQVLHSGTFHRATMDMPGWPRRELSGLQLNTRSLVIGDTMNMSINFG